MMSASVVMVTPRDIQFVLLAGVVVSVFSAVVIPDKVRRIRLDFVSTAAQWNQHDEACRHGGGYLVLLEDPITPKILDHLKEHVGGELADFYTRVVSQDDGQFYTRDNACSQVNKRHWSWERFAHDSAKRCTFADESKPDYTLKSQSCADLSAAICQYNEVQCPFESTSASLASLPVSDANMSVCQDTCRQMTGCFATAPSGHATLPPYTHCLFIITNDSSNPMTTLDCVLYTKDKGPDPQNFTASDNPDLGNCTPTSTASDDEVWPLTDFVQNAAQSVDCTKTLISVSTVVDSVTTTVTQPPVTDYVTVTRGINTATETVTWSRYRTKYVTVPTTVDQTVTTTVDQTVTTTVDRTVPTTVDQTVTVTVDRTVPMTVDQTVTVTVDRTVPMTVDQTVTVTVDRTVPTIADPILATSMDWIVPTTVDQTVTVTVDRTVPTTADQTVTATVDQTVTTTVDRTVPTTADQTVTATADRTVPTTVDQRVTVTVDAGEPCTASPSSISTRPQEEVYMDLESMVKDLTVDPEAMSKQRRKKQSARDERKSALAIGTVAVVFLTLVGLLIVGFDLTEMCRDIQRLKASVKVASEERKEEEEQC